jgi:hypothetical protein
MTFTLFKLDITMRTIFLLVFVIISTATFSQEKADSSRIKLKVNASFSINSNGISSIPAFSLHKPALVSSLNIIKGRFSYDPTLAYSFELRPWYIDNWLHYKIIVKPAFELRAGMNISSYCSKYESDELTTTGKIYHVQRYFTFAITGTYKISPASSIALDYWNDRGQEPGTITGHFIDLTGEKTDIKIGGQLLMAINIQLFYINYDGNNDGLFVSPRISTSVRNVPFTLFFQANQALQSNITPWPGFTWNLGLSYTL